VIFRIFWVRCLSGYYEFVGPNFSIEGCDAKYREQGHVVELTDGTSMFHQQPCIIRVPSRLEVLANDGSWQQHPVVFWHGDGFGRELVIFAKGGELKKFRCSLSSNRENALYQYAKRQGLTEGRRYNIASIPKEGK
jgi:hypothetical protein